MTTAFKLSLNAMDCELLGRGELRTSVIYSTLKICRGWKSRIEEWDPRLGPARRPVK
jgi:hypothetical protein